MSVITLTLTATAVTASGGGSATLTASVTNAAGVPARVVLGAYPPSAAAPAGTPPAPGAAAWTSVERPLRTIAAGATEQYTVTVAPPAGAPAGVHDVRLIAYDADRAPEEYSDRAQQVRVTVPAAAAVVTGGTPWWIWVVAGVLVIAVGVVAFVLLRPSPKPPVSSPSPSPTPTNPCPAPFVPRLARPGDLTCVMPASAKEAEWDNRQDTQRNRVIAGTTECAIPYVPRLAFADDLVCVWEDTANRTHIENQQEGYLKHDFNDTEYPETFTPRR